MTSSSFFRACAILLMVGGILTDPAAAQMRASERGQVRQQINGADVEIDYSRPSVRGRMPAFGGIEPWGTVWTPGANSATTFKFSKDVTLNDVEVAAGKYSVFIELLEDEPWNLLLYEDTTMFHVPYPAKEDALVAVPVQPEEAPSFVETLRFDIEHVRVDGAIIEFRWANTLAPVKLHIDPGYEMVFDKKEVSRYEGDWVIDESMSRPPDSVIARVKQQISEENLPGYERFLASFEVPQYVSISHEDSTGHLVGTYMTEPEAGEEAEVDYTTVLIRRGQGIFVEAFLKNGEIMSVADWNIWEFDFDENGRADLLMVRDSESDELKKRGERVVE